MGARSSQHRYWSRAPAIGLVAVLVVVAVSWIASDTAEACSCGGGSVFDYRQSTDVGFIGTLVAKGESDVDVNVDVDVDVAGTLLGFDTPFDFVVDRWIHGELREDRITIHSSAYGSSCGFEVPIGQEAAIFANSDGDRYVGGLCTTMPAGVALAQIEPPMAADGLARIAVVGDFNGSLVAYFDIDGHFLGYAGSTPDRSPDERWWPQSVWPCFDGNHAVVAGAAEAQIVSAVDAVVVAEPVAVDPEGHALAAQCADAGHARLLQQGPTGALTVLDLPEGTSNPVQGAARYAGYVAVTEDGSVVQVEHLDPGERLMLLAPNGEAAEVARLERTTDEPHVGYGAVATSPDGGQLLLIEVSYQEPVGVDSTLRLVRPRSIDADEEGPTLVEAASRTFTQEAWSAQWLDADHIAVTLGSEEIDRVEVLDAATLATIGTVPDWRPQQSALVDGHLFGLFDGTLYRAPLGGEPEPVFSLPSRTWSPVIGLAERVALRGGIRQNDGGESTGSVLADEASESGAVLDNYKTPTPEDAAAVESAGKARRWSGLWVTLILSLIVASTGGAARALRRRSGL